MFFKVTFVETNLSKLGPKQSETLLNFLRKSVPAQTRVGARNRSPYDLIIYTLVSNKYDLSEVVNPS